MLDVNKDAFVAPLYSFNMLNAWDHAENMNALASHPNYSQITVNFADYVDRCHEKGIRVHPWTCDDPEIIKLLADKGCDAVITNVPDKAREALGYNA